jgi:hypothetical protein
MYHFTLNGVTCGCDTIDELQAACKVPGVNIPKSYVVSVGLSDWQGDAGDKLDDLLKKRGKKIGKSTFIESMHSTCDDPKSAVEVKQHRRRKPKVRRASDGRKITKWCVERTAEELKDLPLLKGAITWAVAHKWAKKLGRDDIGQLRSDLSQRKKLG